MWSLHTLLHLQQHLFQKHNNACKYKCTCTFKLHELNLAKLASFTKSTVRYKPTTCDIQKLAQIKNPWANVSKERIHELYSQVTIVNRHNS